jgi:serine/threonine protein kinase
MIGRIIQNYKIQDLLGEGGMASVYLAIHERLGRMAAIKVIRIEQFPPNYLKNVLRRFEVEARALASLDHPHIVRVFDYGEFEGMPYLVMEHLPGGSLSAKMGKPLRFDQAANVLQPIASALEYAHARGVLHRDVKPSNILFAADGRPVLTDFGIARLMEQTDGTGLTSTGVGIGTPDYMAPEQGMGRTVDGRADVYALGIVLYEMITGHRPYGGTTPMEVILQHFTAPLPPPERYAPNIPQLVSFGVTRALEKNPDSRYPNMAVFGDALEAMKTNDLASLRAIVAKSSNGYQTTMIQPPPEGPEVTKIQSPIYKPVPARDTGPTLLANSASSPARTKPREQLPTQNTESELAGKLPNTQPPILRMREPPRNLWMWLATGGFILLMITGIIVISTLMQRDDGETGAAPTLTSFPLETLKIIVVPSSSPAPTTTRARTETPTTFPTNTPIIPTQTLAPTWTSQVIVVTATPALNPIQWFPVMPPTANNLTGGAITEVTNEDAAGSDSTLLALFQDWGRITSFERYYNHPDGCDSPDLFGVYVQIFVFQTPYGADQFFDWAHEGYKVDFVDWNGERAYLFRNTGANDQCEEDRVSLTFIRGSLAGRIRVRGVSGKLSDAQLVDILKIIAEDIDKRFIEYPK